MKNSKAATNSSLDNERIEYARAIAARLDAGENVVIPDPAPEDTRTPLLIESDWIDSVPVAGGRRVLTVLHPDKHENVRGNADQISYNRQDKEALFTTLQRRREHPSPLVFHYQNIIKKGKLGVEFAVCDANGKPINVSQPGNDGANPWVSAVAAPIVVEQIIARAQEGAKSLTACKDGYKLAVREAGDVEPPQMLRPDDAKQILDAARLRGINVSRKVEASVASQLEAYRVPTKIQEGNQLDLADDLRWIEDDRHATPFLHFTTPKGTRLVPLYPANSLQLPIGDERLKTPFGRMDARTIVKQTPSIVESIVDNEKPITVIHFDGFQVHEKVGLTEAKVLADFLCAAALNTWKQQDAMQAAAREQFEVRFGTRVVVPSVLDAKTYKLRAECEPDVERLLAKVPAVELIESRVTDHPSGLGGDVELVLKLRTLSLDQVRDLCREVEDGHVMLETVQPEKQYTGERDATLQAGSRDASAYLPAGEDASETAAQNL